MPRLTANDFAPEVLQLFDKYVHGDLSRRGFLDSAQRYATGAAGAAGLLAALSPQFAQAQQVAPSDARINARWQEFDSPQGTGRVRGYLVKPAGASGKLPVVLVVHENRGLNPHIEDIARRLALEGFLAFAPDALFPLGGYPGDEDKARELFGKLDAPKTRADQVASVRWLQHACRRQRQSRRGRLLLRRRHRQLPGHPACPIWQRPCPSTAAIRRPRTWPRSRRRC